MGGRKDSTTALEPLAKSTCVENMGTLANKINAFFQSVAAHLPPLTEDSPFLTPECDVPDKYIISVDEVEKQLSRLNPRKATGPDKIPAWVLQDFAPFLSAPLCAVFNSPIREGFVPDLWKTAYVTPLPKRKPPKQIESDLRPISLVPIASKVLEHFVCKWAREAVAPNIHPMQYSAVKGSSTTHALVEMLHFIQCSLDTLGRYVRMLLPDYTKAFDIVNHSMFLGKMQRAGIPACLVKWCAAFLISRHQRVRIGSALSDQVTLCGGTLQGTLLGPLAFIILLGDFDTPGPVEDFMFVDDTSCCHASSNHQDNHLQLGADYSQGWADSNDIKINPLKTKEMVFSFSKSRDLAPLTVSGTIIESVKQSKLLGVTLSADLTWNEHIDSTIKKCNQRLYLLLHLRRAGVPPKDLVTLYKAIIRPVLEYAAPVWHSSLPDCLSKDLEQVQRRSSSSHLFREWLLQRAPQCCRTAHTA